MRAYHFNAFWKDQKLNIMHNNRDRLTEEPTWSLPAGYWVTAFLAVPLRTYHELIKSLEEQNQRQQNNCRFLFNDYQASLLYELIIYEWQHTLGHSMKQDLRPSLEANYDFYNKVLHWHFSQQTSAGESVLYFPHGIDSYLCRPLHTRQVIAIQNQQEKLQTVYRIECLSDLLYIDSLGLWNHQKSLRLCQNCNRYFIHPSKGLYIYCNWPVSKKETCRTIGAMEQHEKRTRADPFLREYRRIYRKHYARHERQLMQQDHHIEHVSELIDFKDWSRKAHTLRQAYLHSNMDEESGLEKLKQLDQSAPSNRPYLTQDAPRTNQ